MKIVIYTFLTLLLCQCQYFDPTKAMPPHMRWAEEGPKPNKDGKPHDPLYSEGWVDGCHTGISAAANSWYRSYYHFKQDAYKAQNIKYYKGWKDAFSYCNRYLYQWQSKVGL